MRSNLPSPSNQARMKVRRWNAARSAASERWRWRVARAGVVAASASSNFGASARRVARKVRSWCAVQSAASRAGRSSLNLGPPSNGTLGLYGSCRAVLASRKSEVGTSTCEGSALKVAPDPGRVQEQVAATGYAMSPATKPLPNPSLERTSTGLALGPRSYSGHHPLRGPSTNPVASAQLKR
jgi:hypothetical protein